MAVIGCGLIGSSVIRAARAAGAVGSVAVGEASPAHRAQITVLGYADLVTADMAEAVADADLVVFAVPVLAMGPAAVAAAASLKPGATVTDVGSVKVSVGDALRAAVIAAGGDAARVVARGYPGAPPPGGALTAVLR